MSVQSTLFMILFDLIMIFLKPKPEDLFVVVFCFPFFFFLKRELKCQIQRDLIPKEASCI